MDLRRTVIVQLRCKPLHCNNVLGSGRYRTSRRLQLRPDEEPGRPSLAVVGLRRRCLVELDRDSCVGTEVGPRPHLRRLRPCIGSGRGPSSLGHSAQHAPLVVVLYRGLRVQSNYSPSTVMAWRPWPAGYRSLFSANHPFHNRSSNQVRTAITTRMSTSDARNCADGRACRSRRRRTVIPPYLLIKERSATYSFIDFELVLTQTHNLGRRRAKTFHWRCCAIFSDGTSKKSHFGGSKHDPIQAA